MALLDQLQNVFGKLAADVPQFGDDVAALRKIAADRDGLTAAAVADAETAAEKWLADRLAQAFGQPPAQADVTEPDPAAAAVAEVAAEAPAADPGTVTG